MSSTDSPWKLRKKTESGDVKRIVVIIHDAKPAAEPKQDRCVRPPGLLSVVMASGTNPMENYSADSIDLLDAKFCEERRLQAIWDTDRRRCGEFAERQCAERRQRTDCETERREECYLQFGVADVDRVVYPELYRIYVRFAAAEECVRAKLDAIPTALQLPSEDVELLIEQGAALLRTADAFSCARTNVTPCLARSLGIRWSD